MSVTLDISASALRFVYVNGNRVEKWGKATLAPGLVRDGHILQTQAVGQAVASLFKSSQMPGNKVTATISGLSFVYRIVRLPRLKAALMDEAITRAAKKEFPLPLEEVYLSWQIIGGDSTEVELFLLGVTRNLIDALVQTMDVAGLKLQAVDLKSLALARLANRATALVANFAPDSFDIVLVSEGRPSILHTVTPQGEGSAIEDNVRKLADELARTVDFHNVTHPATPLQPATPVLLCGELTGDPATVQLIRDSVENPVEMLTSQVKFPAQFPVASYTGNIGLALKGSRQAAVRGNSPDRFRDIDLDILAGRRRILRRRLSAGDRLMPVLAIVGVVLLVLVFLANNQVKADKARLQDQVYAVSRELGLARARADEANNTKATIEQLLSEASDLRNAQRQVLGKDVNVAELLNTVMARLPAQAEVVAVEISSQNIMIDGQANSKSDVISYAENLGKDIRFSDVRIAKIDEVPGANGAADRFGFTLNIDFGS